MNKYSWQLEIRLSEAKPFPAKFKLTTIWSFFRKFLLNSLNHEEMAKYNTINSSKKITSSNLGRQGRTLQVTQHQNLMSRWTAGTQKAPWRSLSWRLHDLLDRSFLPLYRFLYKLYSAAISGDSTCWVTDPDPEVRKYDDPIRCRPDIL